MARQKLRPLKQTRVEHYAAFNAHAARCAECAKDRERAEGSAPSCAAAAVLWSAYLDAREAVDEWQRANSHLYAGRGRGAPWRARP